MTYSWPIYVVLATVFVLSLGIALLLPSLDILRWISGAPAIVALIGAILQIFRDHAQYERTLAVQRDQQHFVLGVTSHMANVAFDKHVEFCGKYIAKMQETLTTLFREGPTNECSALAIKLADIRLSFRTWLTSEIQEKILPFEHALTKIAVQHMTLESRPVGEHRSQTVEEMYNYFTDVLGLGRIEGRGKADESIAASRIMDHLQDVLGVKQLVRLRIALVDNAVKTLDQNN